MFTVCHHFLVQYCANLVGEYPTKNYILLGDDIVITSDLLASKYLDVMKSLGVDISPSKSHVSQNTYEFAKRWFQNCIEISPIPINGIVVGLSNPIIVYSLIRELYDRYLCPMGNLTSVEVTLRLFARTKS